MKKTFVFDMPEDCTECKFNDDDWRCNLTGRYVSWDEVPDHCPFRTAKRESSAIYDRVVD